LGLEATFVNGESELVDVTVEISVELVTGVKVPRGPGRGSVVNDRGKVFKVTIALRVTVSSREEKPSEPKLTYLLPRTETWSFVQVKTSVLTEDEVIPVG
jgi:hypothetical protein